MTEKELTKLRAYYHSLLGQQRLLDEARNRRATTDSSVLRVLVEELQRIDRDFPDLLPPYQSYEFFAGAWRPDKRHDIEPILLYLAAALGRLKVLVDTGESTPVTQSRDFSFVADGAIRKVLQRDYTEIRT